jgi:hypothetical protein
MATDDEMNILEALERLPGDPSHQVLPRLRTLILRVMGDDRDTGNRLPFPFHHDDILVLETFLRSRMDPRIWKPEDRIEKVVIYASDFVDQSPIQEFIDDGLIFRTYRVRSRSRQYGMDREWIEDDLYVHDWPELQGI